MKPKYPDHPLLEAPYAHGGRRYEGKVCIVTGSTLGIGRAIATRMAQEGGKVVISSRKQKQVDETVAELQASGLDVIGVACHQAKQRDRKALVEAVLAKWGRIDVLVLNAAVNPAPGPTLKVPEEQFDKIFEVNVKSLWAFIKDVHPHLTKPGGAILTIASNAAFTPSPPLGLYGVSKTAVVGLSKVLALELGEEGVRVNCLAPGLVRTRFSEMLWKHNEKQLHAVERTTFLHRAGEPWEQAGVAAFLCSDDAAYVTGEVVVAGGGGNAARL